MIRHRHDCWYDCKDSETQKAILSQRTDAVNRHACFTHSLDSYMTPTKTHRCFLPSPHRPRGEHTTHFSLQVVHVQTQSPIHTFQFKVQTDMFHPCSFLEKTHQTNGKEDRTEPFAASCPGRQTTTNTTYTGGTHKPPRPCASAETGTIQRFPVINGKEKQNGEIEYCAVAKMLCSARQFRRWDRNRREGD